MGVSDCIRRCRRCGVEFRRTGKGQPTKYCGEVCRDEAEKAADRERPRGEREYDRGPCEVEGCSRKAWAKHKCAKHYFVWRSHGDASYVRVRTVDKPCAGCGEVMRLLPGEAARKTYCTIRCAAKAASRRRTGIANCRVCAAEFVPYANPTCREGRKVYCSVKCRHTVRSEVAALRRIAGRWRKPMPVSPAVERETAALRRIARWTPGMNCTVRPCKCCGAKTKGIGERPRQCAACTVETRREGRRSWRRTPNGKAKRRAEKARRRAVERGAMADLIDPIRVFERDGWRCHLCGRKTPRELRGTYEDAAPELDHVLPLAVGGSHTWGNVACACRRCNMKKGARPVGQLLMGFAA